MIDRQGHIVELQSIRGIAALVVILGHATGYFTSPPWIERWRGLINGHAAVMIFFVLSGYVLTLSLRDRLRGAEDVCAFYVKRMFRIYPAIWFASLLGLAYLLLLHWNVPIGGTSQWFRERFRPDRMSALYIIASFAGMLAFILPQLWTIFVEVVASALMPLIAWTAHRRRKLFLGLFLVLLTLSLTIGGLTYYGVMAYLVDFVIGASLAAPSPDIRARLGRIGNGPARIIMVLALVVLMAPRNFLVTGYNNGWLQLVEVSGATTIIALIIYSQVDIPLLRAKAAVGLGDISYSLYLLHFPVMCILAKGLGGLVHATASNTIFMSLALVGLTLAVSIPLAWLAYNYIELPGIKLGARAVRILKLTSVPQPAVGKA